MSGYKLTRSKGCFTKVLTLEDEVFGLEIEIEAVLTVQTPLGTSADSELDCEGYIGLDDYGVKVGGYEASNKLSKAANDKVKEAIKDAAMNDPEIPNLQFWGW